MEYRSSDQNVAWFRDQYRDGKLIIKPPFQRKPVWTGRQKCYLIESMLMKLPVPEIYVQQSLSEEGEARYAIVDGQQRMRAALQFIGSELDPEEAEFNKFPLDKLPTTSEWRNKTFGDLDKGGRDGFLLYPFAVRWLNTNDESDVRDMFLRVNKYLSPLKPQELRNASYDGPFARLSNTLADDEYWAVNRIVSPALIRRMIDVEFVSELLIGVLHGPQGGSATAIDAYYTQYEDYEDEFPGQKEVRQLYDRTLDTMKSLFPDIAGVRWSNKTDFYSLFVAIAQQLRSSELRTRLRSKLRTALDDLARQIGTRLGDETAKVSQEAIDYVRAVEKGANDKRRRAVRHQVLSTVILPFFKARN